MISHIKDNILLAIITGLLTLSVAFQGFFVQKVWSHEQRLLMLEITTVKKPEMKANKSKPEKRKTAGKSLSFFALNLKTANTLKLLQAKFAAGAWPASDPDPPELIAARTKKPDNRR